MKKYFYFTITMFLLSIVNCFGVVQSKSFSSSNTHFNGDPTTESPTTYEAVYIYCGQSACVLECNTPNEEWGSICSWANVTYCSGCLDDSWRTNFWTPANGDALFEDVLDEVVNGNYTGNYSLNYINPNNNITYYRTVSWSHNTTNNVTEIDITISYDDGL